MGYNYIVKFQDRVPGTEGAAGRIIMPSGIQSITLERRHLVPPVRRQATIFDGLEESEERLPPRLLLDPQLYLASISPETCAKACSNLVGYPWFKRQPLVEYDSDQFSQNQYRDQVKAQVTDLWQGLPESDSEIEQAVSAAIDFQVGIGCSAIILPSPLTTHPGTSYETELRWLDEGIARARASAPKVKTLATIALSDICTFSIPAQSNGLLDTVIDHVTAREPDGVYIVIEQRIDQSYYISSPSTIQTILRLASEFYEAGVQDILVSWAGLAGFASLAAGAHGWASGWYRKERRLKLEDHKDDTGGIAAPAYYSHRLCGELHPGDLDRVNEAGLLHLVEEATPWAQELFRALRAGRKTADVETWSRETARAHFNATMIRETNQILPLPPPVRAERIARWLTTAAATAQQILKLGPVHERTAVKHQSTWLKSFETWGNANERG